MSKYNVYGIGAALLDTEIQVSDKDLNNLKIDKGLMCLADKDRQNELTCYLQKKIADSYRASGGSAANTIIAISEFGGEVFYSCRVANDDNGIFYLNDLKSSGVAFNNNISTIGLTGKCLVLITPDAERSMSTNLGVSANFSPKDLCPKAISNSEYIYIEGYLVSTDSCQKAAIKARQIAEKAGVKVAVTLSDPAMVSFFKDGLEKIIGKRVDLLFCNESEALSWTNCSDLNGSLKLLKKSASTYVVTLGDRGAIVFDGKDQFDISVCPTNAINTNGAGDIFAGSFLYAITHGYSYNTAGNFAALAASYVVSQQGPRLNSKQYQQIKENFFSNFPQ
jgi:sugar/nucleoside kinase (ribokinase family)